MASSSSSAAVSSTATAATTGSIPPHLLPILSMFQRRQVPVKQNNPQLLQLLYDRAIAFASNPENLAAVPKDSAGNPDLEETCWLCFLSSGEGLGFWLEKGVLAEDLRKMGINLSRGNVQPHAVRNSGGASSSSNSSTPVALQINPQQQQLLSLQSQNPSMPAPHSSQLPSMSFPESGGTRSSALLNKLGIKKTSQQSPVPQLPGEFYLVEVVDSRLISCAHKQRVNYEYFPAPPQAQVPQQQAQGAGQSQVPQQNPVGAPIQVDLNGNQNPQISPQQNQHLQQVVPQQPPQPQLTPLKKLPKTRTRKFILSDGFSRISALEKTSLPDDLVIGTKLLLLNRPEIQAPNPQAPILLLRTGQVAVLWSPPEYAQCLALGQARGQNDQQAQDADGGGTGGGNSGGGPGPGPAPGGNFGNVDDDDDDDLLGGGPGAGGGRGRRGGSGGPPMKRAKAASKAKSKKKAG